MSTTLTVARASLRIVLAAVLLALLGACSSLPVIDREAIASEAIAIDPKTTLGGIAPGLYSERAVHRWRRNLHVTAIDRSCACTRGRGVRSSDIR